MKKKLSCKEIISFLSMYLDKELDDSLCEHINRHMKNCRPCKALLNTLRKTIKLCREFRPKEAYRIQKVKLRKDLEKEIEDFKRFIQTGQDKNTGMKPY